MRKIPYNKSSLSKQRQQDKLYRKLLPSLDLKRRQLTAELNKARAQLERQRRELDEFVPAVAADLPMLANQQIALGDLVRIESVEVGEENVLGAKIPVFRSVETTVTPYSFLTKPHWVDAFVVRLQEAAELIARAEIAHDRVERLAQALKRVTQRVNLFEKVLIPQAAENIRKIVIFLADAERSAVVRSKIFKERQRALNAERRAALDAN